MNRYSLGVTAPTLLICLLLGRSLSAQTPPTIPAKAGSAPTQLNTNDPVARIRDEGMNHSQVMETLGYLTEVIGQRLTGSPNLKRANEWTLNKLTSWGLTNSHLEQWGPFGRGWVLNGFSADVTEPQYIPLKAYPNAWSPGFAQPLVADVVYLDVKTNIDLEKFHGKLKGKIVLANPVREVAERFEPLAARMSDTNLLRLANAAVPRVTPAVTNQTDGGTRKKIRQRGLTNEIAKVVGPTNTTNVPVTRLSRRQARYLSFIAQENAALVVTPSHSGDSGTIFVQQASVSGPGDPRTNEFDMSTNLPRAWATNAPAFPAQMVVAVEDYNRMVRMIQQGEKLKLAVDLRVQYLTNDLMAYNTIAEIPGTDLKDEVVMLGAHLDSWHSGTGATDNGVGVAATMEAVRIIQALKLKPRRTIRLGLWTGEEQGLLGSRAYVSNHFGFNLSSGLKAVRSPKAEAQNSAADSSNKSRRNVVRGLEYEKLSAYFNLDNGGGKIRGVFMQGNEAVRPIFRRWLEPLADLGAETLTLSNTGSTDHIPFDAIGLPGFQFIQDPLDYDSRTHHSNEDVYDRVQPGDLKQCAVVLATFVYNAAMLDEKIPRKSAE